MLKRTEILNKKIVSKQTEELPNLYRVLTSLKLSTSSTKPFVDVNVNHSVNEWAEAIAERLADEWNRKSEFPEDAELLKEVLTKALIAVPDECMRLIGTGIIEESYFESILH